MDAAPPHRPLGLLKLPNKESLETIDDGGEIAIHSVYYLCLRRISPDT